MPAQDEIYYMSLLKTETIYAVALIKFGQVLDYNANYASY